MNPLKRILKGSFWIIILSLLATALGYFTRLILTRTLIPSDYGLLFSVLSFITLVFLFVDYGLSYGTTRYLAKLRAEKRDIENVIGTVLPIVLLFSILFGILLFLGSDFLANFFFHNPKASPLLKISSIYLPTLSLFSIFASSIKGFKQVEKFKSLHTLRKVLEVCIVSFLTLNLGVLGSFLGYVLSLMIITLVSLFLLLKIFPKALHLKFSIEFLKEISKFSVPSWATNLANYGLIKANILILTALTSTALVGLYQTSLPTTQAFLVISGSISLISFPILSELFAKNERKRITEILGFVMKWNFLLMLPIIGILFVFSRPVIFLLFGLDYIEAVPSLKILSLLLLPASFVSILKTTLDSSGKTGESMKIFFIGALINILLCFILIPWLEIIGAAIALLIAYLVMFLLFLKITKKVAKLKTPYSSWGKGLVSTGIMIILIALMKFFGYDSLLQAILLSLFGFSLYFVLLFKFNAFTDKDKRFLKSLLKKIRAPNPIINLVDSI